MNQGGLIYKELSYKINGILFAVHNEIGRYTNEKQVCDYIEEKFKQNKINYTREEILKKSFPGEMLGRNRTDFTIEDKIILEIKTKERIERADYNQIMRYLESSNKKLGLLVNFRDKYLKIHRVLNSNSNELNYSHICKSVSLVNPCMKVRIKRIDKNLPLPEYHTSGSVAFDVYSRMDMAIPAKSVDRIPTNLVIEIPKGYVAQIKGRSSTPKKKGLWVDVGYIDQDYCGEDDEFILQVLNFTETEVKVEKGERLGQVAFLRVDKAEWEEVDQMENNNRGGFGTTG